MNDKREWHLPKLKCVEPSAKEGSGCVDVR